MPSPTYLDLAGLTTYDGLIKQYVSSQGGSATAMTEQEVSDAFDLGWVSPEGTVTITLTNPNHDSEAYNPACVLYESQSGESSQYSGYVHGAQLGSISSPTGSTTVVVPSSLYGIVASFYGNGVYIRVNPTCTDGVSFIGKSGNDVLLQVTGSGTATISNVDYDM